MARGFIDGYCDFG